MSSLKHIVSGLADSREGSGPRKIGRQGPTPTPSFSKSRNVFASTIALCERYQPKRHTEQLLVDGLYALLLGLIHRYESPKSGEKSSISERTQFPSHPSMGLSSTFNGGYAKSYGREHAPGIGFEA